VVISFPQVGSFAAVDRNASGSLDAYPYLVAVDVRDGDNDVVANADGFTKFAS
jgi:hypothetical protein